MAEYAKWECGGEALCVPAQMKKDGRKKQGLLGRSDLGPDWMAWPNTDLFVSQQSL